MCFHSTLLHNDTLSYTRFSLWIQGLQAPIPIFHSNTQEISIYSNRGNTRNTQASSSNFLLGSTRLRLLSLNNLMCLKRIQG